jgi:hypothetical protein
MHMTEDLRSQQIDEKVQRAARRPRQARKRAGPAPEELSPERRAELARQIEARRWRGKPPSI